MAPLTNDGGHGRNCSLKCQNGKTRQNRNPPYPKQYLERHGTCSLVQSSPESTSSSNCKVLLQAQHSQSSSGQLFLGILKVPDLVGSAALACYCGSTYQRRWAPSNMRLGISSIFQSTRALAAILGTPTDCITSRPAHLYPSI